MHVDVSGNIKPMPLQITFITTLLYMHATFLYVHTNLYTQPIAYKHKVLQVIRNTTHPRLMLRIRHTKPMVY